MKRRLPLLVNQDEIRRRTETGYAALKAVITALSDSSATYILSVLKIAMADKKVVDNLDKGIMYYIYAAGLLSFSGREITSESLSGVISSIGMSPDKTLCKLVSADLKSHLIYLYSFYFLLASGIAPDKERLMGTVKALGVVPDEKLAIDILGFCHTYLEK